MMRGLGIVLATALVLAGCAEDPRRAAVGAPGEAAPAGAGSPSAADAPQPAPAVVVLPDVAQPSGSGSPPVPSTAGLRDSCREANSRGRADCACIVDLADRTLDEPGLRLLERAFEIVSDPSRPLVNERAELHAAAVEPGTYLKIDAFVQALRTACGTMPDGG